MYQFYYRFTKQYKKNIQSLLVDIDRVFLLEWIDVIQDVCISIDEKYKDWLTEDLRIKLNRYKHTIQSLDTDNIFLKKVFNKNKQETELEYRFLDTFAWCWWLSLWLSQSWFNPVFVNEIESKYLESYYFNHNLSIDHYHCWDIKDLTENFEWYKDYLSNLDLVVWWPPCQWFSMANRQPIIHDPRNNLYKHFLGLLDLTKPKFFIMENVKWMMKKSSEIVANFHDTLWGEYSIWIMLLNAKNYWIPQNRERVFVIWNRLWIDTEGIINWIKSKATIDPKYVLKDALYWLPALQPKRVKNAKNLENDEIWYKLRKINYPINDFIKFICSEPENWYLYNHLNRFNNDRDIEIFTRLPQWANSLHESIKDIMPYWKRSDVFKDKYYKLSEGKVSKTITSHMKFDCNMYIHPNQPRWLSQRESARIQTFPDDYIFMGSKNSWYAQIWNAVPVKLAEVIWKEIIKYL